MIQFTSSDTAHGGVLGCQREKGRMLLTAELGNVGKYTKWPNPFGLFLLCRPGTEKPRN